VWGCELEDLGEGAWGCELEGLRERARGREVGGGHTHAACQQLRSKEQSCTPAGGRAALGLGARVGPQPAARSSINTHRSERQRCTPPAAILASQVGRSRPCCRMAPLVTCQTCEGVVGRGLTSRARIRGQAMVLPRLPGQCIRYPL